MKLTWTAVVLSTATLAYAQGTTLSPTLHRTVPTERPSENLALGASYTMHPSPNYRLCTDPGDAEQITDGVYTDGYFWAQKSTVGYSEKTPSMVTIDLGDVKPIRGVSYHTAGGFASVRWPLTIRILVAGEDGEFREIGDLVQLSEAQHGPLAPVAAPDAMWAADEMGFS